MDNKLQLNNIRTDIIKEKSATLKTSFNLLANKANYKLNASDTNIDKSLTAHIQKILKDTDNIGYTYNTLPTYNYIEIDEVKHRIFGQCATLEDKLAVSKYYYTNKFIKDTNKDIIADAWDDKFNFFFDSKFRNSYL